MQPLSNPPATIVVLDEKEPLLPLNSQPIIVDTRRSRAKCWFKERIPRALVYGLFFYIMFNAMNAPFMRWSYNDKDIVIDDSFQLESMQDVVNYNDNVVCIHNQLDQDTAYLMLASNASLLLAWSLLVTILMDPRFLSKANPSLSLTKKPFLASLLIKKQTLVDIILSRSL